MPAYEDILYWLVISFSAIGLVVTLVLAYIGFRMVSMALSFAVQYSLAEYQNRKFKNASDYTKSRLKYKDGEEAEEDKPKDNSKEKAV